MKATFDIHDDLYRSVKARSALEGNPCARLRLSSFKPGFVARLIHSAAAGAAATLATFEESARELPNTRVLAPKEI